MLHIPTLLIGIWFTTSSIALPAPSSLAIRTTPGVPDLQQLVESYILQGGRPSHTDQILPLDWEYWVERLECAGFIDKDGVLMDPTTSLPLHEQKISKFSANDMYIGELCLFKKKDPSRSMAGWYESPEDEWKRPAIGKALHEMYEDYATRFNNEWKVQHGPSQARPVDTHQISGPSTAAALHQPFAARVCDRCAVTRSKRGEACIVNRGGLKCTRCKRAKQGCYWGGVSISNVPKREKGKRKEDGGTTSGL